MNCEIWIFAFQNILKNTEWHVLLIEIKNPKSEAWRAVSQDGKNWVKKFRLLILLAFG